MRYKFTIEYDGGMFPLGWQSQKTSELSVQKKLQSAALQLTGNEVLFYGAGRTDSGVNAIGQVAHADFKKSHSLRKLHLGMNYHLKKSGCKILRVEPVKEDFHARFSAISKTYLYRITNDMVCSVFDERHTWWIPNKLDWEKIEKASQELVGTFDFTSMCDARSENKIRTLDEVIITRDGNKAEITFKAKSFLHKQVRIMVGTLIDIGRDRIKLSVSEILKCEDRLKAGVTAPANGLFLLEVEFAD